MLTALGLSLILSDSVPYRILSLSPLSDLCSYTYLLSSYFSLSINHIIIVTQVHVRYMSSSVRLSSVVCLSVRLVHPTHAIEIIGDVSKPFGTLAIC